MLAPNVVADDVTNAVDAFDRDLGLERIGPDIVNNQPQSSAAESSDSATMSMPPAMWRGFGACGRQCAAK
jgi:hypothetical protein